MINQKGSSKAEAIACRHSRGDPAKAHTIVITDVRAPASSQAAPKDSWEASKIHRGRFSKNIPDAIVPEISAASAILSRIVRAAGLPLSSLHLPVHTMKAKIKKGIA